jgi:hypothetical protein
MKVSMVHCFNMEKGRRKEEGTIEGGRGVAWNGKEGR